MKKKFAASLLILVAIVAAYAPVVHNDFVWDDTALVLRDPLIRSWRLIPEGFQHFLFIDATASDFYRPIQRLSFTLDYAAFGFMPAAFHVTSVACHAAAAIALFFFAAELLHLFGLAKEKHWWVPLVVALAWALHPLHTSAIAYISGRADPLAAAFGFVGLYLGLRSLRATGARTMLLTSGAALAFLLSALSKEAGLIFVPAWLTIVLLQKNWRAVLRAGAVALFVATAYLSLRLPAEHIAPPAGTASTPLLLRPILVARAFAEYSALTVLPLNLHMERDVETHPSGFGSASMTCAARLELQTLAGVILLVALVYWLFRERKRDRSVFLCLLLTLLTYLPVSGVFLLNAALAEHWLYLPTAFFFCAVALSWARFVSQIPARNRWLRPVLIGAAAAWMLFLGGRTFLRTFDWRDQRTFLERTVATGGDSARMLINLGGLEMKEGHLDSAKKLLQAALAMEPGQPMAVLNRAALAVKENDFAAAHELLARATEMPLIAAQAHELLAVLESKETGNTNLMRMRLAAHTGAPNWLIEKRYVALLRETGATDTAIAELQHCLETQWYRAESWQLLGELLRESGRNEEAAQASTRAHLYDVRLDEASRPLVR